MNEKISIKNQINNFLKVLPDEIKQDKSFYSIIFELKYCFNDNPLLIEVKLNESNTEIYSIRLNGFEVNDIEITTPLYILEERTQGHIALNGNYLTYNGYEVNILKILKFKQENNLKPELFSINKDYYRKDLDIKLGRNKN